MEEPSGIIALIEQLKALSGMSKGLPKDQSQIPKGIVPSPEGSSFTKNTLSPTLSPTERNRVKQIAEIFKQVLAPGPEARKIDTTSTGKNPTDDSTPKSKEAKIAVGVDEKSQNALGVLGSILGIGEGLGTASIVAASALPILAAVAGAAGAIYVGGPASKLFAEALVTLSGANWDGLDRGAKIAQEFAYVGMDFVKLLHSMGLETIQKFFEIGRLNMAALAASVGIIATNIQLFRNVEWEDVQKATVALGGLIGMLAVNGAMAPLQALSALILSLGGNALVSVGAGITELSIGVDNLFKVVDTYKDLPLETMAAGLGALIAILGTVAAAGIASPLLALGSLASQLAGVGLTDLSVGLTAIAVSVDRYTDIDASKLQATGNGIMLLSAALLGFASSGFASSVINSFSSIFGSDGFTKFLTLADKADKLATATISVTGLKDAFKEFAQIRTDNIAYNLNEIVDAVDSLNIDKLKRIYQTPGGIMSETAAFEMKTIREYLLFGTNGNQYGIIGMQKDLLNVNTDQLKTLKEVKAVLVEIRAKIPTSISGGGANNTLLGSQRGPAVNNFRDEIKSLTIQPSFSR